jgi:predicted small lipoprotein YifL
MARFVRVLPLLLVALAALTLLAACGGKGGGY